MAKRSRGPALLVLPAAIVIALWMATPALSQQQYPITTSQPPVVTTVQPGAPAPAPAVVAPGPGPHAKVAGVVAKPEPASPAVGGLAFTGFGTPVFVAGAVWLFALAAGLLVTARRRAATV
jgi:hypothetical protein